MGIHTYDSSRRSPNSPTERQRRCRFDEPWAVIERYRVMILLDLIELKGMAKHFERRLQAKVNRRRQL
jgi:hypothetical protein